MTTTYVDGVCVHFLKTIDIYFGAVARGEKLFEVRRNDRFYQAGDLVVLMRMDAEAEHWIDEKGFRHDMEPGWQVRAAKRVFRIGPVLQGGQFGIEPGFCVFSLLPAPDVSLDGRFNV